MKNKLLGVAQAILLALVILSGAIALPILCRPFFYAHIAPMQLTEAVGLTASEIKTAYNEMMNYCIGLRDTFSAGSLPFSQEGMSHFADVRKLFLLDLWVLAGSVPLLALSLFAGRRKQIRLAGHTSGFWSATGLAATFLVVGGLVSINFEKAFEVFHTLFFPGKDNWLFDSATDPIILMLPAEFFRNCAILIFACILLACGGLLLWDAKKRKK
ncbi:MAG: TIGR01906 family membrane protein [Oscillospiraceae bacterium]|nr:TIGR01906 family membrane protein [Oscillospiraceae bacterium]